MMTKKSSESCWMIQKKKNIFEGFGSANSYKIDLILKHLFSLPSKLISDIITLQAFERIFPAKVFLSVF